MFVCVLRLGKIKLTTNNDENNPAINEWQRLLSRIPKVDHALDTRLPVPFNGRQLAMGTDERLRGTPATMTAVAVQSRPGRPMPVAHNPLTVALQEATAAATAPTTALFEDFVFRHRAIFDERPGYFTRIIRARFTDEEKFEALFARYSTRMADPREIIDMIWATVFE